MLPILADKLSWWTYGIRAYPADPPSALDFDGRISRLLVQFLGWSSTVARLRAQHGSEVRNPGSSLASAGVLRLRLTPRKRHGL
jgi:hypothetical protein